MGKPRQRQKADGISKLRKADKKRAKIKLGTHNQEYTSVCDLFGNWVAGPPKEPKSIASYYYVLSSCLPGFWREVGANRPWVQRADIQNINTHSLTGSVFTDNHLECSSASPAVSHPSQSAALVHIDSLVILILVWMSFLSVLGH